VKEIKEILAADLAKNYKNESTTVDEYYNGLQDLIKSGTKLNKIGATLFIYKYIGDTVIEFHSANAETKEKLIRNCSEFLKNMSNQNIKKAVTFFDNPKSINLLEGFGFPFTTEIVNKGKYATYKAEVSL
jgi:hypothetical protein